MTYVQDIFEICSTLSGYRAEDWDILHAEADQIMAWGPDIVKTHYDALYDTSETRAIFEEGEREKLEKTLAQWLTAMTAGRQDDDFWDHQYVIGLLHVKRDVKNLYMLSMMNRLQQTVMENCYKVYEAEKAAQVSGAFLRISGMISSLIAECYIRVVERISEDGLAKVGMNPALQKRIKDNAMQNLLEEFGRA